MRDRRAGSTLHLTGYTICHSRQVSGVPRISTHNNQMKTMAGFSSIGNHLHRSGVWIIERCGREQGGWIGMYACQPNPLARLAWLRQAADGKALLSDTKGHQGWPSPRLPSLHFAAGGERERQRGKGREENDRDKERNWGREQRGSITERLRRCCPVTAL